MLPLIVLLCTVSFAAGCLAGAMGYYAYANHMYMKHPELFKARLERKIRKRELRV